MKQSPEYTLEDLLENIKEQFPESDEAFIYQWHHPVLKKYYIGSHVGTIDDSYTGSGIDFRKLLEGNHPTIEGKYPIEEWERTILTYCSKEDEVKYAVEQLFLIFYDAANNPKFLNRTNVADGFGTGEDNCKHTHGLYVGCPQDARRVWFNSLPPERQEAIRSHESERNKIYQQENKEKIRSYLKEYYQENKEKRISQQKEYCEKNKEKIRSQKKEYYQENKEMIRSYNKEYYQENKEKRISQQKEYYEKLTPEQKQRIIDTKRIRRHTIRSIIEMDNTYTKEYFKGMKHEEVLKIGEEVKKNIENNRNTLERFWE